MYDYVYIYIYIIDNAYPDTLVWSPRHPMNEQLLWLFPTLPPKDQSVVAADACKDWKPVHDLKIANNGHSLQVTNDMLRGCITLVGRKGLCCGWVSIGSWMRMCICKRKFSQYTVPIHVSVHVRARVITHLCRNTNVCTWHTPFFKFAQLTRSKIGILNPHVMLSGWKVWLHQADRGRWLPRLLWCGHWALLNQKRLPWKSIILESVWAKGSSNSGGLSNIFTFSHFHIFTSSHNIFKSSHLLTSNLHIFSSSHPHIFTSSHLHIFSSSHLVIFTSHLHIFSSSHLLIFSSSHLHIFSSSHLHIFISSHSLLPSCSLALLLSPSFLFLSWRRGAVPTRRHETQPFRTKRGSIAKSWGKVAISRVRSQPFRTKRGLIAKNLSKIAISRVRSQPFCTKWVRSPKTEVKLRFAKGPAQPFRTKWGSIAKNWGKVAISRVRSQRFRTKRGSIAKNWGKIVLSRVRSQPFGTKCGSIAKNCGKIAISRIWWQPFRFCVSKLLCVKVFVCKSFCV